MFLPTPIRNDDRVGLVVDEFFPNQLVSGLAALLHSEAGMILAGGDEQLC